MKYRTLLLVGLVAVATAATCDEPTAPDTCIAGRTFTIGTPVEESVAGGDCVLGDRHADSWQFTLANQSTIRFNVDGQTETDIRIRDNGRADGQNEIALHDNAQTQFATFVTLPAGSYTLDVAASDDGDQGAYTINSAVLTPPAPVGCLTPPGQIRFAAIGTTDVAGAISNGDCPGAPTWFFDNYNVYMAGGQARKVTVTASAGTTIEIRRKDQAALATNPKALNTGGANIVQFTPSATGYYAIGILAAPGTGTVTYTLRIE